MAVPLPLALTPLADYSQQAVQSQEASALHPPIAERVFQLGDEANSGAMDLFDEQQLINKVLETWAPSGQPLPLLQQQPQR